MDIVASVVSTAGLWMVLVAMWGGVSRRHGDLFMEPALELFLFSFSALKSAGVDSQLAWQLSEKIFLILCFSFVYSILKIFRAIGTRSIGTRAR